MWVSGLRTGVSAGLWVFGRFDPAGDFSIGERCEDLVTGLEVCCVSHDLAAGGSRHRVASTEHLQWAESLESGGGGSQSISAGACSVAGGLVDTSLQFIDPTGKFVDAAVGTNENRS